MSPRLRAGALRHLYEGEGHPGTDDHVDRILAQPIPASTHEFLSEEAHARLDRGPRQTFFLYHAHGKGGGEISDALDIAAGVVVLTLDEVRERLGESVPVVALVSATDPDERGRLLRQLAYACPNTLEAVMRTPDFPWPPTEELVALLDTPTRWVRELGLKMIGRSRGGGDHSPVSRP